MASNLGSVCTPLLAACALASWGCSTEPGTTDSISSSATTEAGAETTTEQVADTTTETLDSSTTGSSICSFETSPAMVTLRIVNARDMPVFFDSVAACDPPPGIDLSINGGTFEWFARECESKCADASEGMCTSCDPECEVETVLRIEPGGAYEAQWSGQEFTPTVVDESCPAAACGAGNCVAPYDVFTGSGELSARVWTGCSPPGGCNCTPNAEGYCVGGYGDVVGGDEVVASVGFEFPGTEVVELVIE